MVERKRDVVAIGVAASIADTVNASGEARQTGILVGARAYRRGQSDSVERVTALEAEVAKLKAQLLRAEQRAGWTPAEVSYIHTLRLYGMAFKDIAETMGVAIDDVREALRLAKSKKIRKAADRRPRRPGQRAIDTA